MTDTYEKCSCGSRQRSRCVKESGMGCGKMCLKPFDLPSDYVFRERMESVTIEEFISECVPVPNELFERMDVIKKKAEENRERDNLYKNFRETLNGGFCADIDYESEVWQRVLSDWEGFKLEEKK